MASQTNKENGDYMLLAKRDERNERDETQRALIEQAVQARRRFAEMQQNAAEGYLRTEQIISESYGGQTTHDSLTNNPACGVLIPEELEAIRANLELGLRGARTDLQAMMRHAIVSGVLGSEAVAEGRKCMRENQPDLSAITVKARQREYEERTQAAYR